MFSCFILMNFCSLIVMYVTSNTKPVICSGGTYCNQKIDEPLILIITNNFVVYLWFISCIISSVYS
jgi:hypothetical protein